MRRSRFFSALLLTAIAGSGAPSLAAEPAKVEQRADTDSPVTPTVRSETEHVQWISDLAEAQKNAHAENKDLYLLFTGSDWCSPCAKLERELLHTPEFIEFVSDKYVLVVLDFPQSLKLPESTTAQNERVQQLFNVNNFPTAVLADANALPYSKASGFGGVDSYWRWLKDSADLGKKIRVASAGTDIGAITNPGVFEQVLSLVPEDLLAYGWPAQLERIGSSNQPGCAEFQQKWSTKLSEFQAAAADREALAVVEEQLKRLKEDKAEPSKLLAVINTGLAEAQGRPARLSYLVRQKIVVLEGNGDNDQAITVLKEMLSASWPNSRERGSARGMCKRLLFSAGRIDEGLAMIVESEKAKDYPSQVIRKEKIIWASATELNKAGQYVAALPYLRQMIDELEPDFPNAANGCRMIDTACQNSGQDHGLRGQALLMLSRTGNGLPRATNPEQQQNLDQIMLSAEVSKAQTKQSRANSLHAATAAVCFRAANQPKLAQQAWATIEKSSDPTNSPAADESAAKIEEMRTVVFQGSVGDALKYLGNAAASLGRGVYFMEAAINLRQEQREAEATPLAQEAIKIFNELNPEYPDKAARQHLQQLINTWSGQAT